MAKLSSRYELLLVSLFLLHTQIYFSSSTSFSPEAAAKRCHPEESAALIQFINSFSINKSSLALPCFSDQSSRPRTWEEGTDCCSWVGVECDKLTGHVVRLDFSCSWLQGAIPSNCGLFHLPHLQSLDLSCNNFSDSSIPSEFGKISQLQSLHLMFTNVTGKIPDTFGNLSQLKDLNLRSNNLNGQLPFSIFNLTQLQCLDFSSNQLVGPLPSSISGLSNLYHLDFSHNMLTGKVPSWLFTTPSLEYIGLNHNLLTGPIEQFQALPMASSLNEVYLYNNQIHGPIPGSLFQLVNVTSLCLFANNLTGVIDWSMLQNMKELVELEFSENSGLSLINSNGARFDLPKIEELSFSSCNLSEFPSFFGALENLQTLDLTNNRISGHISNQSSEGWKNLSSLFLSHNLLTGLVKHPWSKIHTLDLRYNLLQGPPVTPPVSTVNFLLSDNQLSGEIPPSICNLSSLSILDLSNNNLIGVIPRCLGNFSNGLFVLKLRGNNFHGSIPETFENCSKLEILDLKDNKFEGKLPRSLKKCGVLEVLDMGNNNINDTFPTWLEAHTSLRILILRNNSFHGTIGHPRTRFPFPKLQILDLSHNFFTGFLPATYLQKLRHIIDANEDGDENGLYVGGDTQVNYYKSALAINITMKGTELAITNVLYILTSIDFSNNQFEGEIPPLVGRLKSLIVLNFSHNSLTGHIPSLIANLTQLESLDLSSNQLVGKIPLELTSLTYLAVLNLSYNQLEGPIPRGKQFSTFSNDSYVGNLGLCGFPLSKICESNQPQPNKEDDSAGWFNWKVAAIMGYGSGLVIGISIGYIIFTTRRPLWFVILVERKQNELLRRH